MYVALNISSSNVKILALKGRQVNLWASLALAGGLVRDGIILQPEAVAETIAALFKSSGIPRERVITSIAGLSFTYRFLSLPHIKPALLEEAILRSARKEISIPLDELYLCWHPLPARGEEQDFFMLGVPRNLIDTAVQTLKKAGVEPYLMDLRPLALARAANRNDAIVVNLEPDCFDIVFIADSVPRVIHSISPRGEGATLEDNIRRLVDELSKTATFYQSNHPDSQLSPSTPLLLSGDLAAEPATSGLLQSEIEYPVEPLVPPVEFPPELPLASYAASIGLALKKAPPKALVKGEKIRYYDININLFAGKYRKARVKPPPLRHILFGISLVIFIALLFPLNQARTQLRAENAGREIDLFNISRELNLANLAAENVAEKEDIIKQITASIEAVKTANRDVLGTRGDFTANLHKVTGALPPRTYYTSIEITHDLITIQGETDSVFTAIDYAIALESKEAFSEVRITRLDEAGAAESGAAETDNTTAGTGSIAFEILISK
jgi:type IV pilus assembly protein PilM